MNNQNELNRLKYESNDFSVLKNLARISNQIKANYYTKFLKKELQNYILNGSEII